MPKPYSDLTQDEIDLIRKMWDVRITLARLAKAFDTTEEVIRTIISKPRPQ